MPDSYNYTDAQIRARNTDGKDSHRAATSDQLAAAARSGDQAALHQLMQLAHVEGTGGWATEDARNYSRMLLRDLLPGYQPQYGEQHDGGGFLSGLGHAIGGALKVAAPIAALAIPGLGPLASAAIAGGGSALGGALHGDPFNLGKTLLAGGVGYGGNMLLGGQGIGGIGGIPGRLGLGGGAGGIPPLSPQGIMAPGGGVQGAVQGGGGGGGFLNSIFGGADGKVGIDDILKYGTMIGGGISAANSQNKANQERDAAVQGATQEWQNRAPLRGMAQSNLMGLGQERAPDLSGIFADPGNPFYRRPPPLTPSAPAQLPQGMLY